jgi:hypothetical protein
MTTQVTQVSIVVKVAVRHLERVHKSDVINAVLQAVGQDHAREAILDGVCSACEDGVLDLSITIHHRYDY